MDRQIVYAGSIPLDTDLLSIQRHVQVALGALAQLVLGSDPVVDRIGCIPGTDPYSLTILPGSITMLIQNDSTAFGALAADPTQVMRTAELSANTEVALSAPPDAGHVLTWLIQAQINEQDVGAVVLPYWNAADPSVPYSGPGNSGQAQATTRQLGIAVVGKSSGPQTIDAAGPPGPDPGWVGLFVVTTYFGKTGIEVTDIAPYAGSQRLRYTLASSPPAATTQAVFGASTSWKVPELVRWVKVRAVGGGGGGGGGDTAYSGGGGGAGGYAEAILAVVPGQVLPISVGAGGAGGQPGGSGVAGGDTSFGSNLVAATGGSGGGAGNPDSHGGAPGQGAAGTFLQLGGYGSDGGAASLIPGGNGGASMFGGGGRGANDGGGRASGVASGSGGGGGYGPLASGGAGAAGIVVLEW